MGSYVDALSPWISVLGVVVNGYLDYMISWESPPVRPRLHQQMLLYFLLLVFGLSFKLAEACRP